MTGTGLPPQAYTKETLAEAYKWVNTQPDHIRRAATSSDALVGLYLNAQRRNQEGFDSFYDRDQVQTAKNSAPVSGEQFKKELKSLAIGLDEFVDDSPAPQARSRSTSPPQVTNPSPSFDLPAVPPHVSPTAHQGSTTTTTESQSSSLRFSGEVQKTSSRQTTSSVTADLDAVSQQRLSQVRASLNLSSDTEALRMLITLGFEKIKGVLPPS